MLARWQTRYSELLSFASSVLFAFERNTYSTTSAGDLKGRITSHLSVISTPFFRMVCFFFRIVLICFVFLQRKGTLGKRA